MSAFLHPGYLHLGGECHSLPNMYFGRGCWPERQAVGCSQSRTSRDRVQGKYFHSMNRQMQREIKWPSRHIGKAHILILVNLFKSALETRSITYRPIGLLNALRVLGVWGKGRNSLAVQWWRLCASTVGGLGLTPGWGIGIPHATWCSQTNKKKKYSLFIALKYTCEHNFFFQKIRFL